MAKFKVRKDVAISHLGNKAKLKAGLIIEESNEYFELLKQLDLLSVVRNKPKKVLKEKEESK